MSKHKDGLAKPFVVHGRNRKLNVFLTCFVVIDFVIGSHRTLKKDFFQSLEGGRHRNVKRIFSCWLLFVSHKCLCLSSVFTMEISLGKEIVFRFIGRCRKRLKSTWKKRCVLFSFLGGKI